MGQVQGYVDKNNFNLDNISGRLKTLGYEIKGQNFIKNGQIESVLNELVPCGRTGSQCFRRFISGGIYTFWRNCGQIPKGKVERKRKLTY